MKTWHIVVPALLGLALAGCRNDPSVELLERDNFKKEQEIYRLRDENAELKATVSAAAPAQPGYLRNVPPREMPTGEMPPEPGTREGSSSTVPRTRPGRPSTSPGPTIPEPETSAPGGLNISPGLVAPPGQIPDRLKVPGENSPRPIPPSGGPTLGRSSTNSSTQWTPPGSQPRDGNSVAADNRQVAQITLHPALTGGVGTGSRTGDEGLLVVVEPRDFSGKIINAPGDMSVALLDPALSGDQARLGRWDFAAAQTQGMLRSGSQPGIHARLPWKSSPAHDRLKVFVRYTTSDGRKLQAERLISVALDGPAPAPREALPDPAPAETASRPQRPQWSPVR